MRVLAHITMRDTYGPDPELPYGTYYLGGGITKSYSVGDISLGAIWSSQLLRPTEQLESPYSKFFNIYGEEYPRTDYVYLKGY